MSVVANVQLVAAPKETLAELLDDGLFIDGDWIESKDQDPNGEVRLIQLADVGDGVFRDRSARFLTMAKAKELRCTFLQPGDILVARMPEPLGRACIFPGVGRPAVTAVDVCILRPHPDRARSEWLVKAINAPAFRAAMQEFVRGTTRQRISRKNLGTLRLTVPSVDEQLVLAELVERMESKRGAAAGHVTGARKAIERFRQAVLAAACSGQLTDEWRETDPDLEPASVLIERSIARLEDSGERPRRYDVVAPEFIKTPASWEWAPIGWLAAVKGGIQKQPKRAPKQNAYPYLRVANVHRGRLDLSEIHDFELFGNELETYRLEHGDLLIVEGNGSLSEIGRSAIWGGEIPNCVHQNHIIRVRCVQVEPAYVDLFWNSPFGSREIQDLAVTSAGLYSLSTKKIASFAMPVPPIEEQREIVRRVCQLFVLADRLQQRVGVASKQVERSSQAVLAKAFRAASAL